MARRNGRKKNGNGRRKFRGINLWNLAEAYVQTNIITQNVFNADPASFLFGRDSGGLGNPNLAISNTGGKIRIGVGELLGMGTATAQSNWDAAAGNFKDNWLKIGWQTIGTNVAFRFAKKATRKMRRQLNAGFQMAGIRSEVMV